MKDWVFAVGLGLLVLLVIAASIGAYRYDMYDRPCEQFTNRSARDIPGRCLGTFNAR